VPDRTGGFSRIGDTRCMKRIAVILVAIVFAAACGSNPVLVAAPTPMTPSPLPPATPTLVAVTVSGLAAISSNAQMTASARYSDSSTREVTSLASWESSAPSVATVSSTGVVAVVATGDVELRATYQNAVGTMRVTVTKPAPPATFVLTGIIRDSSTRLPLAGVGLQRIGDSGGRTTTDQAGAYTLGALPAGRSFVEFTKSGYQLLEISVTMAGNQQQDVSLDPVKP
jgi:hypothetical protein